MPLRVPKEPAFTLQKELKGSKGAINVLLFSDDGGILLSGGDDERVRIWNMDTLMCDQVLENEKWGQVTTLTWIYQEAPSTVSLCVGSARGFTTILPTLQDSQMFDPKEAVDAPAFGFNDAVEALAFDRLSDRLALASHSGAVKVYTIDKLQLTLLWANNIGNAIPRGIFFVGGPNKNVMTVGLETGELCCWEASTGNSLWRKQLASGIGHAALSADKATLLVDNLSTGKFDVYQLPADTPVRSLSPVATRRFIKQCHFLDSATTAVCGSDTNKVHIIDVTRGQIIQTLAAGEEKNMMQVVASTTAKSDNRFIAGGANRSIYLWEQEPMLEEEPAEHRSSSPPAGRIQPYSAPSSVNGPVILLVVILTYPTWSPYLLVLLTLMIKTGEYAMSFVGKLFGERRATGPVLAN